MTPKSKFQDPKSPDLKLGTWNLEHVLKTLLASPNICSKRWVYEQYDSMVRTNTAVLPGADAAVIRIKETRRGVAMCLDGNAKYVAIDPKEGVKLVVAEAARNVACVGAKPIAVTNCLNFASPERPEVMWSFSQVIDGLKEACEVFETPVVSGNVSFYNETDGRGILPTPVIGMVGLVEDTRKIVTQGFKNEGDVIALIGETRDDLAASEFAQTIAGLSTDDLIANGLMPNVDLEKENQLHVILLKLAEAGLLSSAHDCSDGGIAVTIAECCFSSLGRKTIGVSIDLESNGLANEAVLFGETPSRVVISFGANDLDAIRAIIVDHDFAIIGRVGGKKLNVNIDATTLISTDVSELESAWSETISATLEV